MFRLLVLAGLAAATLGAGELTVVPQRVLRDADARVRIEGLQPGEVAVLDATALDADGKAWSSRTRFRADEKGRVDVMRDAPVEGAYTAAQPMGFFWSMRPHGDRDPTDPYFAWDPDALVEVELTARATGRVLGNGRLEIAPTASHVHSRAMNGGVGRLFYPEGLERGSAVLVLGGSEGGFETPAARAALLASHGHAALALAYFGVEPLPSMLVEIPLESIAAGLDWLRAQPEVDPSRIGVMGTSKGGELALLLASRRADLRCVVAYVPSSHIWQGIPDGFEAARSSWTSERLPLPFVPFSRGFMVVLRYLLGWPAVMRDMYDLDGASPEVREAARIPIENASGPVLLVTGADDQLWDSAGMSDRLKADALARGSPHRIEHLSYTDAGHLLRVPYGPIAATATSAFVGGGTVEGTQRAGIDAWPRVLAFLGTNLRRN